MYLWLSKIVLSLPNANRTNKEAKKLIFQIFFHLPKFLLTFPIIIKSCSFNMRAIWMNLFFIFYTVFKSNTERLSPHQFAHSFFNTEIDGLIKPLEPTFHIKVPWASPTEQYEIFMAQSNHQFLPEGYPPTKIFAYGARSNGQFKYTYPGPSILAFKDIPIQIVWTNNIEGENFLPIQKSPPFDIPDFCISEVCTVPHVHGLETEMGSDGQPMGYFTISGYRGHDYFSFHKPGKKQNQVIYRYENKVEGLYWYHDHSMGLTRLNVYAGLIGYYQIVDPNLSPEENVIMKYYGDFQRRHFIISDKSFNTDGSLYYPSKSQSSKFKFWVPQFFGDTIVVNGKVWPFIALQKKIYRFVIVNGCQSRFLNIYFEHNGQLLDFELFRRDSDFLKNPLRMKSHNLIVGGRIQIFLNLKDVQGQVYMRNNAPTPFPSGDPANEYTSKVLKLIVKKSNRILKTQAQIKEFGLISSLFSTIKSRRNLIEESGFGVKSYSFQLFQKQSLFLPNIGLSIENQIKNNLIVSQKQQLPKSSINIKNNKFPMFSPQFQYFTVLLQLQNQINEVNGVMIDGVATKKGCAGANFRQGGTYDFYIINLTEDDHPMHIHLVNFQVISRFGFDLAKYEKDWMQINSPKGISIGGIQHTPKQIDVRPYRNTIKQAPLEEQQLFLDVILVPARKVTVARVKFADRKGGPFPFAISGAKYVWHCHILEHQDNEMMRYLCIE